MKIKILDKLEEKIVVSEKYNFVFNKKTGFFARWGKNKEDDPLFSPIGPEIADIEISVGDCLGKCKNLCYKKNGEGPVKYMPLSVFKKLIKNIGPQLCQVALGITNFYSNPDFEKILSFCRNSGIIPNYTTHGLDIDDHAAEISAKYCGAVSVSLVNQEKTYDTIKKLTDLGMSQINMHFVLSKSNYKKAFKIIDDACTDPRLKKMNAIVFLSLKPKGFAKEEDILSQAEHISVLEYASKKGIQFGSDSCGSPAVLKFLEKKDNFKDFSEMIEPCESFGLFSSYFNYLGDFYPCSFCEGEGEWKIGISCIRDMSFLKEVWFSDKLNKYRKMSLDSTKNCVCTLKNICRKCIIFNLNDC